MKKDFYFIHEDDEFLSSEEDVIAYMEENDLKELTVFLGEKDICENMVFCGKIGELVEKQECNKRCCKNYEAKTGRRMCIDRGLVLRYGEKVTFRR